jgi:hypothetical protein
MGYQLRLTGVTTITFEITPDIDFQLINKINERGLRDQVDIVLPIHGFLRGDEASVTFGKWLSLFTFATNEETIVVEILLDSAVVLKFDPADSIGSPHIRNLETVPQGGSLVNMVEFTLDIIIRKGSSPSKTGSGGADKILSNRESQTDWYNSRFQRKAWRIKMTGNASRETLLRIKPPLEPIFVSEVRQVDENSAEIEFAFEQTQDDKYLKWHENIHIIGGANPRIPVYRTDGADPIIELGRNREVIVTVDGQVWNFDKKVFLPGSIPSLDKYRDDFKTIINPVDVDDGIKGTYTRKYKYVYILPGLNNLPAIVEPRPKVRDKNYPSAKGSSDALAPGFLKAGEA